MLQMWDVGDVGCLGCEMSGIKDVRYGVVAGMEDIDLQNAYNIISHQRYFT